MKQETIALLPEGETIEYSNRRLYIEKRLNSGLTGEVYRGILDHPDAGEIPVAVKVMKTLEFPMVRQLFLQESETLAFMEHLEKEANAAQNLSFKIAPHYYGRGEYHGNPFIVMEFIQGEEVPALLMKQKTFPEPQALRIAWHLFRTLDIMHTNLQKT